MKTNRWYKAASWMAGLLVAFWGSAAWSGVPVSPPNYFAAPPSLAVPVGGAITVQLRAEPGPPGPFTDNRFFGMNLTIPFGAGLSFTGLSLNPAIEALGFRIEQDFVAGPGAIQNIRILEIPGVTAPIAGEVTILDVDFGVVGGAGSPTQVRFECVFLPGGFSSPDCFSPTQTNVRIEGGQVPEPSVLALLAVALMLLAVRRPRYARSRV